MLWKKNVYRIHNFIIKQMFVVHSFGLGFGFRPHLMAQFNTGQKNKCIWWL